jgi:hypothetical protein
MKKVCRTSTCYMQGFKVETDIENCLGCELELTPVGQPFAEFLRDMYNPPRGGFRP